MPAFLENLGFEALLENEDVLMGFVSDAASKGEVMRGYSGNFYINHHYGSAQIVVRAYLDKEKEQIEVKGFDTHSRGCCNWRIRISDAKMKNDDILQRKCIVSRADNGRGMAIINLINADVLPCYSSDEIIEVQPIGFPIGIHYYKNSEDFEEKAPANMDSGEKMLPGNGAILPLNFLVNHRPDNSHDADDDDVMLIRGRVKGVFLSYAEIDGQYFPSYINTIIGTQFGDLEIVHTEEQVEESERENICVGAEVVGSFVLCGDVAMSEYENGAVFDEEHDLLLLRDVIENGSADRLYGVLEDNAVYISKTADKTFVGKESVIDRFRYIHNNSEYDFYGAAAELKGYREGKADCNYPEGKKCILVVKDCAEQTGCLMFIETNEEGKIRKIVTDDDSGYLYEVFDFDEDGDECDDLDTDLYEEKDLEIEEVLFVAASNIGKTKHGTAFCDAFEDFSNSGIFEENSERIVSELYGLADKIEFDDYGNIFNYIFIKTAENCITQSSFMISDTVETVLNGMPEIKVENPCKNRLERTDGIGSVFLKSLDSFVKYLDREGKTYTFSEIIKRALTATQRLGELYGECLTGKNA